MNSIVIRAGSKAFAHLHEHGLRAQDIALVAAAAGGPKGLILQALDQWLFGTWLPNAPRERTLIGSSIGAWRMAAACHTNPVVALQRLADLYCEQRYSSCSTRQKVTETIQKLLNECVKGHEDEILTHPHHRLQIITARERGLMRKQQGLVTQLKFGAAMLSNGISRSHLAPYLSRVVIGDIRDPLYWLKAKFDAFDTDFVTLSSSNLLDALLASASLPFIMDAVSDIPDAPKGHYWDGGLIDYQLELPYARIAGDPEGGLVLFPHYSDQIIPGWFDKRIPWRRAGLGKNSSWLDNVLLIAPSSEFLQTLSRSKLPDRKDFNYYGSNHDFRIQNWKLAISEGERLRDAFAAFVELPNLEMVREI